MKESSFLSLLAFLIKSNGTKVVSICYYAKKQAKSFFEMLLIFFVFLRWQNKTVKKTINNYKKF
jgi:hypothetical protein